MCWSSTSWRVSKSRWPGEESPVDAREWSETVDRFQQGLEELDRWIDPEDLFSDRGSSKTASEIIQMIAAHHSYQTGQIAGLRRWLGAWSPPSGGATR